MRANESDSRKNFTRANGEAKATATAKFGAGASRANASDKATAKTTAKATAAAQALYKAKYFVIALLLAVVAITSVGVSKWNIHIQQVYNNNFSYVNNETANTSGGDEPILTRYLKIDYTKTAQDSPGATAQPETAFYRDTLKTENPTTFTYNGGSFDVKVSDGEYGDLQTDANGNYVKDENGNYVQNNPDASPWSEWKNVGLGFTYAYKRTARINSIGQTVGCSEPLTDGALPTNAGVYQCVIKATTTPTATDAATKAAEQLNYVDNPFKNDGTKCAAVISFTIKQRDITVSVADKTSTYGDDHLTDKPLTATTKDVVANAEKTTGGNLSKDLNSIVRLYTTKTENGTASEYELERTSPAGKYGIEGSALEKGATDLYSPDSLINDNYKVNFVYPGEATQPQGQNIAFNGEREAEANPLALYVGAGSTAVSFANNTASNTAVAFASNVAGKPQTQPVANGGIALLDGESPAGGTEPGKVNENGTYTITTRKITVTIYDQTSVYGYPLRALPYELTGGSLANGNTLENIIRVTTTATSTSDVGEYPITGSQYNENNQIINANYAVTFVGTDENGTKGVYTITKRPVTITWNETGETAFSYVYNRAEQKPNPTFDDLLSGHSATVTVAAKDGSSLTSGKSINKGDYTMTVALPSQNYKWKGTENDSTDKTQDFSITARPITVTIADKESVYGENIAQLTAQVTSTHSPAIVSGDSASDIYTLSTEAKQTSPVGTYAITGNQKQDFPAQNYDITFVGTGENGTKGVYTITKRPVTITWNETAFSYVYNGTEQKPNPTFVGLLSGHNATVTVAAKDGSSLTNGKSINKGDYTMTVALPSQNYKWKDTENDSTDKTQDFSITARQVTITWTDTTLTYTGTAQKPTAPADNLVPGDSVTVIGEQTNAGQNYTATATINDNYDITNPTTQFTINKLAIKVKANNQSATYTGAEPTTAENNYTITLTSGGTLPSCVNNELSVTVTKQAGVGAGTYTLTPNVSAKEGYSLNNYNVTKINGTFTINKATVDVPSPAAQTFTYNGTEQTYNIAENVNYTIIGNKQTNAGSYTATVSLKDKVNYRWNNSSDNDTADKTYNFTISKAPLTVKANSTSVIMGQEANFTYTITGFKNGETEAGLRGTGALTGNVTFTCGYNKDETNPNNVSDTYVITPDVSDLSATNYTFTTENGTLTVNKNKGITKPTADTSVFTYNGSAQTYTPEGFASATMNITGNVQTDAGTYTVTVTPNTGYVWSDTNNAEEVTFTFTIGKKSLTITATSTKTTFVYGEKVYNAVSYETSGLVSGETITGLTYTYPTNKELTQNLLLDVGDYTISANVNNATTNGVLLSVNYNVTCYPVQVTVNALKVKLEGTLVYPYGTNTTLTYKKGMFNGKFVSSNNPGNYDLSDLHNSISSAIAQNYIGEATEANESAGKFYYTLDTQIKAGSTYRLSATLSGSNIVCDNDNSALYLKYQTAMIGSTYYTIEDALNASGNITLAGNNGTLDKTNYVITSFSHLTDYYNNKTTYTLDDTLNLPVNSSGTVLSGPDTTVGKDGIYSVLIITKNINLIINGTMNIGGHIFANGNTKMTVVYERSVVMNNGNITLNGTINANGFLKGNYDSVEKKHIGLITANYGSEIIDWMRPFNWPGGTITNGLHNKKIFPFEAYTLHNNSCDTKINPGATYMAKLAITASFIGTNTGSVNVVAPSEAMFTITTGYIMKTVSDDDLDVTEITGSNQGNTGGTKQHDVITIYGECHDNQINATIAGKTITTSTDYPLPIGFMDIVVATDRAGNNGKLTLAACSYKFYPGSKLIVEQNAELIVGSSASLTFYDYETCIIHENKDTGSPSKAKYSPFIQNVNDKVDAKLVVNGTATVNGSIGGLITTNASEALLTISKNTSSIKIVTKAGFVAEVETVTFTATGVQTAGGSATPLDSGNYSSVGSADSYYWVPNDRIKTVTFNYDDGTGATHTTTVILTNDSYNLQSSDFPTDPTRDHYTFGGWFTDTNGNGTEVSAGYTITDNITLHAKWTPETYTIIYHYVGCTEEQATTITNPNASTYTYDTELPLNEATIGASGLSFGGWFTEEDCINEISTIAKGTYGKDGKLRLYGKWTAETPKTYEITLRSGKSGVTLATSTLSATGTVESGANYKIPSVNATWNNETTTAGTLNGEWLNNNYNFDSYFIGWKLTYKLNGADNTTDYCGNAPTIAFDGGAENITLTARWAPKIKLTIEFKDTKGGELLTEKTKYFMSSDEPIPLSLIDESIRTAYDKQINNNWTDHTEYYFDKWLENGTETESIVLNQDKTLTAQYKRCYHVIITGDNVTGTGTKYVAPTETSYNIVVSGNISENVHRYKITRYTCDSDTATVTNGTLNFNGADSATDITVTVTTIKQWAVLLEGVNDGGSVTISVNGETQPKATSPGNSEKVLIGYFDEGSTVKIVRAEKPSGSDNGPEVNPEEGSETRLLNVFIITVNSSTNTCLAAGTLITLADGSKKKVEDVTENDMLLVFNHYTGRYDFAKVLFNDHEPETTYTIINLRFSAGNLVKVVYEHGFFDLDLNKYVYINETNYQDFVGHRFYSATWDGTTYSDRIVTLNSAYLTQEKVKVYSPVTKYHMNYFTEDLLSMPGGVEGIFNIFEYGEGLKFDEAKMQRDIELYGEFTYEDFKDLVTEEIFNSFQTRYFTVAIGKGNLTMERIQYYIERYGPIMMSGNTPDAENSGGQNLPDPPSAPCDAFAPPGAVTPAPSPSSEDDKED